MIEKRNCNPTIEQLYDSRFAKEGEQTFKVSVKLSEHCAPFGIVLTGGDKKPDCKVSSFTANIYFRTRNGLNYRRYTTLKGLKRAIKNIVKHYGYTYEKLIIQKGNPYII